MDTKYGFEKHKDSSERLGWLLNMHPVSHDSGRLQDKQLSINVFT
jgi:hypothetical protein